MKFSIIIPVYNGQKFISRCLNSILNQKNKKYELEILVIDDCSSDNSFSLLKELSQKYDEIVLLQTEQNSGPGIARNLGIKNALGEWIMFVDSDDKLAEDALLKLFNTINTKKDIDIISYDFIYDEESDIKVNRNGRIDFPSLIKDKKELIQDYLSLYMDGSVIYTLISRKLLEENNIKFYDGVHEDVDYIFKVYVNANNIALLEKPIYIKNNRDNSIVNSLSKRHIEGFYRAYMEMFKYIEEVDILNDKNINAYYLGLIGVCATRIREVYSQKKANSKKIYTALYNSLEKAMDLIPSGFNKPKQYTKYFMMYRALKKGIEKEEINIVNYMNEYLDKISNKSWSCYDLQHSVFLAPNEIRTCCKRFFKDNKLKGDVPLLSKDKYEYENFTLSNILKEKKRLYFDINKGESEECSGCPFLEFKEWEPLNNLDIQYLSFEYHSVCNMKCTYCSDTYYDGKKSKYDVAVIVDDLVATDSIKDCNSIVWGGGEPTLDNRFLTLIEKIANGFPNIKQRVITNATVYKEDLKEYIDTNKASIVTSIDAGTQSIFQEVRKNKNYDKVIKNLVKYSENNPQNVTIKYIILDQNKSIDEIKEFINIIKKNNLQKCNFQISFDFKKEQVDFDSAISIIILYGLLVKANVQLVFFDDLLRTRFDHITEELDLISVKLEELGYGDILADNEKLENIVIWGAGNQTKNLLTTTKFFQSADVSYIVDNTSSKIGKKFMGYNVYDPSKLKDGNNPILISAVQSSPKILEQFIDLGLDKKRIIKKLIL